MAYYRNFGALKFIGCLFLFSMVFYLCWPRFVTVSSHHGTDILAILKRSVPNVELPGEKFNCIETSFRNLIFPMCLHSDKDCKFISKVVHSSNGKMMYEIGDVKVVMDQLEKDPDIGLIDIGANIGTYTLPAAHLGHKVVAVEMNRRTATRLMASVTRGRVADKVGVYQIGLSNVRQQLRMIVKKGNIGDSRLVDELTCIQTAKAHPGYYCDNSTITTLVLDDLLSVVTFKRAVLKIDAQGAEIVIFKNASMLFQQLDLPMVFLEWDLYKTELGKGDISSQRRSDILDMGNFFLNRGYVPYDKNGKRYGKLFKDMHNWPYNIIFKKSEKDS